ncbi:MAG: D-3-phosphoglycerate dehydrogenase [Candidatus Latescibacterota bacterium]|jgi:lactate dehydrogenase-like 2-hydroxyacid dehydrogenase
MESKILITAQFRNDEFASSEREAGMKQLAQYGDLVDEPEVLNAADAEGIVASAASSSLYTDEFYAAASNLRIIARWGVGFDKVNVEAATRHGVLITVTPVHMDTVAEYTIAQWMATLKRVYTLNRLSHGGDFSIIRTYEAQGSTLGLFGCGRIGQEVAQRARPLLGDKGRLLMYDTRPDIKEIAAKYGAEAVDSPQALFEQSDTISLHVAGDDTIVDYDLLSAMQPHASLVNPSRGNLVDDEAVNRAINEDKLYYYVVDDPVNGPRAIHKDHPRIICTNHNAGISVESTIRLDQKTIEQITDTLEHRRPDFILNEEVLEHPRVKEWLNR